MRMVNGRGMCYTLGVCFRWFASTRECVMNARSDLPRSMTEEKAEYLKFVALLVVLLVILLVMAALSPRLIGQLAPKVLGLDSVPAAQPDQAEQEAPVTEPDVLIEPETAPEAALEAEGEMDVVGLQHEVQPGQTLFQIAELYGVSVGELAAANHLVNPLQLEAGTILFIPQQR